MLDARNIYDRYIDQESSCSISLPKSISGRVLGTFLIAYQFYIILSSLLESNSILLIDRLMEERITPDIFDEAKSFVRDVFETRLELICSSLRLSLVSISNIYFQIF